MPWSPYQRPFWVTVKTFPPTVIVVFLVALAEFFATLNPIFPLPVPLDPEVMVTHVALLAAVQLQFVQVDTAMVPCPPTAGNDWLVGEIE